MSRKRQFLGLVSALALAAIPVYVEAGTTFVYDSAGRVIQAIYSNGVTISYVYDSAGNRRQITTTRVANRVPVAVADSAGINASAYVDIQVRANDSDPDGDPITVSAVSAVSGGGTAAILGGGAYVRYTAPASGGTKTFTYTLSDGRGGSASAMVTINVTAVNHNPVADDDTGSTTAGASTPIYVTANDTDPDGNGLTVSSVGSPSGGYAYVGPGGAYVIYTAPSAVGQYSFTYTISDGNGGSASATVYVDVSNLEQSCGGNTGIQCEAPP
jgi:YD repeat-containing protein